MPKQDFVNETHTLFVNILSTLITTAQINCSTEQLGQLNSLLEKHSEQSQTASFEHEHTWLRELHEKLNLQGKQEKPIQLSLNIQESFVYLAFFLLSRSCRASSCQLDLTITTLPALTPFALLDETSQQDAVTILNETTTSDNGVRITNKEVNTVVDNIKNRILTKEFLATIDFSTLSELPNFIDTESHPPALKMLYALNEELIKSWKTVEHLTIDCTDPDKEISLEQCKVFWNNGREAKIPKITLKVDPSKVDSKKSQELISFLAKITDKLSVIFLQARAAETTEDKNSFNLDPVIEALDGNTLVYFIDETKLVTCSETAIAKRVFDPSKSGRMNIQLPDIKQVTKAASLKELVATLSDNLIAQNNMRVCGRENTHNIEAARYQKLSNDKIAAANASEDATDIIDNLTQALSAAKQIPPNDFDISYKTQVKAIKTGLLAKKDIIYNQLISDEQPTADAAQKSTYRQSASEEAVAGWVAEIETETKRVARGKEEKTKGEAEKTEEDQGSSAFKLTNKNLENTIELYDALKTLTASLNAPFQYQENLHLYNHAKSRTKKDVLFLLTEEKKTTIDKKILDGYLLELAKDHKISHILKICDRYLGFIGTLENEELKKTFINKFFTKIDDTLHKKFTKFIKENDSEPSIQSKLFFTQELCQKVYKLYLQMLEKIAEENKVSLARKIKIIKEDCKNISGKMIEKLGTFISESAKKIKESGYSETTEKTIKVLVENLSGWLLAILDYLRIVFFSKEELGNSIEKLKKNLLPLFELDNPEEIKKAYQPISFTLAVELQKRKTKKSNKEALKKLYNSSIESYFKRMAQTVQQPQKTDEERIAHYKEIFNHASNEITSMLPDGETKILTEKTAIKVRHSLLEAMLAPNNRTTVYAAMSDTITTLTEELPKKIRMPEKDSWGQHAESGLLIQKGLLLSAYATWFLCKHTEEDDDDEKLQKFSVDLLHVLDETTEFVTFLINAYQLRAPSLNDLINLLDQLTALFTNAQLDQSEENDPTTLTHIPVKENGNKDTKNLLLSLIKNYRALAVVYAKLLLATKETAFYSFKNFDSEVITPIKTAEKFINKKRDGKLAGIKNLYQLFYNVMNHACLYAVCFPRTGDPVGLKALQTIAGVEGFKASAESLANDMLTCKKEDLKILQSDTERSKIVKEKLSPKKRSNPPSPAKVSPERQKQQKKASSSTKKELSLDSRDKETGPNSKYLDFDSLSQFSVHDISSEADEEDTTSKQDQNTDDKTADTGKKSTAREQQIEVCKLAAFLALLQDPDNGSFPLELANKIHEAIQDWRKNDEAGKQFINLTPENYKRINDCVKGNFEMIQSFFSSTAPSKNGTPATILTPQ